MPSLTVIICTHNPREAYLRETLDALRTQTIPPSAWQLLIVDNASREPLATKWDLSWHPNARFVREENLGTAHARFRALREAQAANADLILFVDDDNILARDYIEKGLALGEKWPQLGCWGGQLLARFESEPPSWLENYKKLLAIFPLSKPMWTNRVHSYDMLPPTAGCFLRRAVWERYVELLKRDSIRLTLGACGQEQIRGEDTDLVLTATDVGYGVGRFPELTLEHIMPSGRLTVAYMENLITGATQGIHVIEYLRDGKTPAPVARNWLERFVVNRRARRLPEPISTFYRAELRGRERAAKMIADWKSGARASAPASSKNGS